MKKLIALILFLGSYVAARAQCTVTAISQNPTVTAGQPVTFSVTVPLATSWQWVDGYTNQPIAGATSSTYTVTPTFDDWGKVFTVHGNCSDGEQFQSLQTYTYPSPPTTPTTTFQVPLGIATAADAANSLGLVIANVDNEQVQFAQPAAMGATIVRSDACQWENFEIQVMPGNTSGGFVPNDQCTRLITLSKKYGMRPDSLAYWAPPHSTVATGALTAPIAIGDTSIQFSITSGSIPSSCPAQNLLLGVAADNGQQTNVLMQVIDSGAPIRSFSGNTYTLVNATSNTDVVGDVVTVNCLLYPPVVGPATGGAKSFISNPGIVAWMNYLKAQQALFVANDLGTVQNPVMIELYNEPENPQELWDCSWCYDPDAPRLFVGNVGILFAYAATYLPRVPTVRFVNGWTNLSGGGTIYITQNGQLAALKNFKDTNTNFISEAVHPYFGGYGPEQTWWRPDRLQSDINNRNFNFSYETQVGAQVGANFKFQEWWNRASYAQGGINPGISETGVATADDFTQTRGDTRHWLGFTALGVKPIIFYIWEGPGNQFAWTNDDDSNRAVANTFGTRIMPDIKAISGPVIGPINQCLAPQVTSYSGYWPLDVMWIVGTRTAATANSYILGVWQQTYGVPPAGTIPNGSEGTPPVWQTPLQNPASVPFTVTVHSNETVTGATKLNGLVPLTVTPQGDNKYLISDVDADVAWVTVEPASAGTVPSATCTLDQE